MPLLLESFVEVQANDLALAGWMCSGVPGANGFSCFREKYEKAAWDFGLREWLSSGDPVKSGRTWSLPLLMQVKPHG